MKQLIALYALCAFVLTGCGGLLTNATGGSTATALPAPAAQASLTVPPAHPSTTATSAPTSTPEPPSPTPSPAPPRVGLQVGHWRIEEHPEEQARLRRFSGNYYRGYDEWEVNIVIAEAVQERLEAAGVTVDLLPATVPISYTADAFIAIHVDGVTGAQAATRRGWKVATPFRASAASEALAEALATAYPEVTGLPYDTLGPSYDMRAYYAFAYYRYWHSLAPTTPAVIIECGFMTHPADRALIFEQPAVVAEGIARGVLAYLEANHPVSAAARAPVGPGMLRPIADGLPLFTRADPQSPTLRILNRADRLVPMARADGWYLVFTHGGTWELGWVRTKDVMSSGEPLVPPSPRSPGP